MLLILTTFISNRLRYIADLVLKQILGIDFRFTISVDEFTGYEGPKIIYARQPLTDELFIESCELLFETSLILREVQSTIANGLPVLFESGHPLSALPFDPLAAAFYLVSRYEEYYPHKKDSVGRYPAEESIAWRGKFLDIPIVHFWAEAIGTMLHEHFPGLKFRPPAYRFIPTIDVDHAWCYLERPFLRTLGGFGRSFAHGHFQEIAERIKVLSGTMPDPYDNYQYINSIHGKYGNFPLFFILFADYGRNDNNVTVTSKNFHLLIRELDRQGNVGIHPSHSSNKHLLKLGEEYRGLSKVLDRNVTASRQHFLKLAMPETYRNLIQLGITDDYSMGYASHTGFRAGIAIPFQFYDLLKDEVAQLTIHPVSVMDVTLRDYLRLSRVEALEKIKDMIRVFKAVNGEYVSLWHNESLGDTGRWNGWRSVYEEMVKLAST